MINEGVAKILDATYSEWRKIDPYMFETFEEYADLIGRLLIQGILRLGSENKTIH